MENSLDEYRQKLARYSKEELREIRNGLDRERFPDRAAALAEEFARRRTAVSEENSHGKAAGSSGNIAEAPELNKYRTLPPRLGAMILDAIIFGIPFLFLSGFLDLMGDSLVLGRVLGFVWFAVSIGCHWRYGATPGKFLMGIRIVDNATEGPITLRQAFLRDSVPAVAWFLSIVWILLGIREGFLFSLFNLVYTLWSWAEILSALTNPKRRAVHDFIAGTVCIRVKPDK